MEEGGLMYWLRPWVLSQSGGGSILYPGCHLLTVCPQENCLITFIFPISKLGI